MDLIINNEDDKTIKDRKKNRLNSDDLPSGNKFKINTITIVIKAIIARDDKYYPQISLNNILISIKC